MLAYVIIAGISEELRVQLNRPNLPEDVEEGGKVTLICRASGNPVPMVTWYHDQTPVVAGPNVDISGTRLKIKSATPLDSGIYSCMATNIAGSTPSTENVQFNIVGKFGEISVNLTHHPSH